MSAGGPIAAIYMRGPAASRLFDLSSIPPKLVAREAPALPSSPPRRSKIWEFSQHLHCSIIGTCLSTGELRQILKKLGVPTQGCSDHELHGTAVTLSGRHDDPARQLNKALDRRHKLAVSQFAKATDEAGLRTLWADAVQRGEIPGAYWATVTHPAADQAIIREAFGEVHMLSHLVGSANRADIRRLCELENDKATLEAKLNRQQIAFHEAVVSRDKQITDLRKALTQRVIDEPPDDVAEERETLRGFVTDLQQRLSTEAARRTSAAEKLAATQAALVRERAGRIEAERDCEAMRQEVAAIEVALEPARSGETPYARPEVRLDGVVLLYVGGRPNQVAPMRAWVERLGATFLHHDGGLEHNQNLLPGLASRSNIIIFPVDCISHDAGNAVKSLCRQSGKRFIPLRSAGVTSLLTALRTPEMTALSDARRLLGLWRSNANHDVGRLNHCCCRHPGLQRQFFGGFVGDGGSDYHRR